MSNSIKEDTFFLNYLRARFMNNYALDENFSCFCDLDETRLRIKKRESIPLPHKDKNKIDIL